MSNILDGVFYRRVAGNGPWHFILIHNAGGDHRFFHPQIDYLCQYGDVIELDLPGHGNSKPNPDNSLAGSAKLIAELTHHLNLDHLCLIGLNNGGDIALEACHKHQLPIKKLVLIDPPLFMDKQFVAEVEDFIAALDGNQSGAFITDLVDALFIQTSAENKHIAFDAFSRADKQSLQAMFRSLIEWNSGTQAILDAIDCPTLCLLTDEHHCAYQTLKKQAPHVELAKLVRSKCWATLEVPEQVNAMIGRFLTS